MTAPPAVPLSETNRPDAADPGATPPKPGTAPPGLDLASFEQPISLRNTEPRDFDRVMEMQQACFPGMKPWRKEQLASHLEHFPEGQFVVEVNGKVVGSASSLILDF